MNVIIRNEKNGDIGKIHAVTVAAFRNAPHTSHTEQFIVRWLRDSGALSVSLVAEVAGEIVGHVALSPVEITDGSPGCYGLGPLSVHPEAQNKGIGSRLVSAALTQLDTICAQGCVLLGDPGYYAKFGFKPVAGLVLEGVAPEYFQALLLRGDYAQGEVVYHESFAAEKFGGE